MRSKIVRPLKENVWCREDQQQPSSPTPNPQTVLQSYLIIVNIKAGCAGGGCRRHFLVKASSIRLFRIVSSD